MLFEVFIELVLLLQFLFQLLNSSPVRRETLPLKHGWFALLLFERDLGTRVLPESKVPLHFDDLVVERVDSFFLKLVFLQQIRILQTTFSHIWVVFLGAHALSLLMRINPVLFELT